MCWSHRPPNQQKTSHGRGTGWLQKHRFSGSFSALFLELTARLLLEQGDGVGGRAGSVGLSTGERSRQGREGACCRRYGVEAEFGVDSGQLVDVG